ncbi:MAG: phosphohistidine phosphatase [Cyclobacteriaceae bacterium]|jgi:phosphohistidine phosphatase
MKSLYIIRHAKSSWSFDLEDHQRPLGFRGRKDMKKMGLFLSHHIPTPDLIISSTAIRALDTALFIADDWGYPEEEIKLEENFYHATSDAIISVLKRQQEESIAIIGHNPGLTELANHFLKNYVSNIPTTGCVGIQFDIDDWTQIENEDVKTEQLFFHTPKSIKMMIRKYSE